MGKSLKKEKSEEQVDNAKVSQKARESEGFWRK